MNQKTNDYRKKIAEMFVKSLQEENLNWKKGWKAATVPQNAVTGKNYKGLNRFYLSMVAMANGMSDPRWATFKQIQDKGWKLAKGSKGMEVEYWSPYDFKGKKHLTWREYDQLRRDPDKKDQVGIIAKYYHVFNAKDIEGIPPLEQKENRQVVSDKIIEKLSQNMGVPIINDGGDRAFYRVTEDKIHLPRKEYFHSTYEYNSTALHECAHATGAAHRLNRDLQHAFGTEEYAKEELRAEICSLFMGEHLEFEPSQESIDNHKAYVQSWIKAISEKPAVLMEAIKDAEQAANYLEFHAEIINANEYMNTLTQSREVDAEELNVTGKYAKVQAAIISDIQMSGFHATPSMVANIEKLNGLTGKENSLKDISDTHKLGCLGMKQEEKDLVCKIAEECRQQEVARQPGAEPEP